MPSRRQSREGPLTDIATAVRPHFEEHDALTWPFPETSSSPVWQAWRAARDADRRELKAKGWAAVGLQQVMASRDRAGRRQDAGDRADAGGTEARHVGPSVHGHHADRLDIHFGVSLAQRLRRAALETLGDVAVAHSSGRHWWALAPGIGPRRAHEIVERVRRLLEASA